MCCTRLAGNIGCKKNRQKSPSEHHHTTLSGYIFATKARIDNRKKLVKQQYLLHTFPQYGELQPTNGWDLLVGLEHPNKFQRVSRLGFVTASTSLNRGEQNFARCLTVSWAGTLYILFFGGGEAVAPWRNFVRCKSHFVSKSCVFLYWQCYCTALEQWSLAKLCGVVQGMELQNFRRRRHLYSTGRPSCWASAHILVSNVQILKFWVRAIPPYHQISTVSSEL